jgi:membrane protein
VPNVDDARALVTDRSPEVQAQRAFSVLYQIRALCAMNPRRIGSLLLRAYNDWSADGASRLGAALAYYTLFSVAPILIVVTGIVGLFVGQAAARGQIAPWLERLLSPEGVQAAELMLKQSAHLTGGILATLTGLITLFLGTSALVNELRQSLNIVWRVQGDASQDISVLAAIRAMLSERLYAFFIVIGSGLLVILSLVINTAVAAAGTYFQDWLPLPEAALQTINFVVSFGLTTTMFTLVYKMVPDAHVAWGDAWVGAMATAFLFNAGGMLFSVFVGKTVASVYGTAASVLALLVWVYYSAQVFFYGAELTRIFANECGGRIVPSHRSLRALLRRERAGQSTA